MPSIRSVTRSTVVGSRPVRNRDRRARNLVTPGTTQVFTGGSGLPCHDAAGRTARRGRANARRARALRGHYCKRALDRLVGVASRGASTRNLPRRRSTLDTAMTFAAGFAGPRRVRTCRTAHPRRAAAQSLLRPSRERLPCASSLSLQWHAAWQDAQLSRVAGRSSACEKTLLLRCVDFVPRWSLWQAMQFCSASSW